MPTLKSSRFLRAADNAEANSAAPPTSATIMKPTKAGESPRAVAACCTDSTNTSLTNATSTVTPASVTRDKTNGHSASPGLRVIRPGEKFAMCLEFEQQPQSVGDDKQHR